MNIGPTELGILVLLALFGIVPLVIGVWALIDIAQRTDEQLAAAGQNRTTWLIVAILTLFVPCVFVGAAYYLLAIRPRLPPRRLA
jgi:hypothetical protein